MRMIERFNSAQKSCQQYRLYGHDMGSLVRWFLVAFGSVFLGLGILYTLIDGFGLSVWLGSILCAEIGTLFRFVLNEHFVFRTAGSLWERLVKYHLANIGGYLIWLATINLTNAFGIHYLIGSVMGMAASMTWSIVTNFGWVWKAGIEGKLSSTIEPGALDDSSDGVGSKTGVEDL